MKKGVLLLVLCLSVAPFHEAEAAGEVPFPYELDLARDLALISTGTAVAGISCYLYSVKPEPGPWEVFRLRRTAINPFDRPATRMSSRAFSITSDALFYAAMASPLFLSVPLLTNRKYSESLTVLAMYCEVLFLNVGVSFLIKGLVHRERPYMYDKNYFHRYPNGRQDHMSFISLHSSAAFSSAVFMACILGDLYPDSGMKYLFWFGGMAVAGITGLSRIAAGKHFPTDVIAGAVSGSAIGALVPLMHHNRIGHIEIQPLAGEFVGIEIRMQF